MDCGSEFLNDLMVAYCTQEQILLTRGRPAMKNDQCHVEARNRYQVRDVVGHDRYSGEYAYRQLTEVYRALRLYINCFQPSMKLLANEQGANPVRRRYDPAKTPLQRLLLSGVLSPAREQELIAVAQALDPVRLLSQLQALQQALFRCAINASPFSHHELVTPIQVFAWQRCIDGSLPPSLPPVSAASPTDEKDLPIERLLIWRRTRTNLFEGEWVFIASSLLAHPDLTTPELFQQLQHRSPGSYHDGHLRSLQRGVRHIRTQILITRDDPWKTELIHGALPQQGVPFPLSCGEASSDVAQDGSSGQDSSGSSPPAHRAAGPAKAARVRRTGRKPAIAPEQAGTAPSLQGVEDSQDSLLEQAIHAYLQEKTDAQQSPDTVMWHRISLGQFQQYLHTHQQPQEPESLTEALAEAWLTHLQTTPGATGALRAASTVGTYARSLRAFGNWLVNKGMRSHPLLTSQALPPCSPKPIRLVEPETFFRLLAACWPPTHASSRVDCATARNQALLWLMWESGLQVSEICVLRVGDVFASSGIVQVAGKGAKMRRIALGPEGQQALQTYLQLAHGAEQQRSYKAALFTTETGQPLTTNALTLLFVRLNQRAGSGGMQISPTMLRDTFAVRYLQTGGNLGALQEMLGLSNPASVRRYQQVYEQGKRINQQMRTG